MTQDEIIEMAMQSELITFSQAWGCFWVEGLAVKNGKLKAFAKLVAAKEREALANHFDAMPSREMFGGTVADEIRARGEA